MSLIDRLRQMVGPADSEEKVITTHGASEGGASDTVRRAQSALDAARDALADLSSLASEEDEIDTQIRYWGERLRMSERLVEREPTGSKELVHATDLVGKATQKLAGLESFRRLLRECLENTRPSCDEAREILTGVRSYQDQAQAATSHLPPEQAAVQAAVFFLDQPDATGSTRLRRLEHAQKILIQEMVRLERSRPME